MPWPCGASKEPITLPFLSIWIMAGGRTQQSASGGLSSASSSIYVRSLGRSNTHTLSSLSTASPVTPPIFHLLGSGLGQSGSNLNLGAVGSCAPSNPHKTSTPRPANAFILLSRFMNPPLGIRFVATGIIRQRAPQRIDRKNAAPSERLAIAAL